jgi:hypothetical protein
VCFVLFVVSSVLLAHTLNPSPDSSVFCCCYHSASASRSYSFVCCIPLVIDSHYIKH